MDCGQPLHVDSIYPAMIGGTEGEVQKSSPFSWKIGPKVSHSWLSFANNYSHFGALPMIQYIINCLGSDSRKPKRKAPRRLSLETMERRELFATDLLSVVSAGNEPMRQSCNRWPRIEMEIAM